MDTDTILHLMTKFVPSSVDVLRVAVFAEDVQRVKCLEREIIVVCERIRRFLGNCREAVEKVDVHVEALCPIDFLLLQVPSSKACL